MTFEQLLVALAVLCVRVIAVPAGVSSVPGKSSVASSVPTTVLPAPFAPLIPGSNKTASPAAINSTAATAPPPNSPFLLNGLRFLYQNDLNWTRAASLDTRTPGYLMLTQPVSWFEANGKCSNLTEQLVDPTQVTKSTDGLQALQNQLRYLSYEGSLANGTLFWIASGGRYKWDGDQVQVLPYDRGVNLTAPLRSLCTQSAPWSNANATDTSRQWWVEATSGNLTFRGFRDALSFRFGAVKYGNNPQRFTHSIVNPQTSGLLNATDNSTALACPQTGVSNYTENCLVANVYTTYLPRITPQTPDRVLRPVMVWLHGGGYTTGTGLDPNFLGGNLASRGDVVVVTPNYRLGFLGFAALSESNGFTGNWALGDVITALRWVKQNVAAFGGDPENVTLFGQSAGANLLIALLSSQQAQGLFHSAIIQSGQAGDSYTARQNVSEVRNSTIQNAQKVGCTVTPSNSTTTPPSYTNADIDKLTTCLRAAPVAKFIGVPGGRPIVDGKIILDRRLNLTDPTLPRPKNATAPLVKGAGFVNRVPLIVGFMRDELGSLGTVPKLGLDLNASLAGAGVSPENITVVLNNTALYPIPQDVPNGIQNLSVTVATDINNPSRRCGTEAQAYAFAKNHVFPNVYAYTFDTRAYQIPFYDPFNYCRPNSTAQLKSGAYGLCHSGDLLPVFNTYGWYGLQYRDELDLPWSRNIADQWTAFARWKDPYVRQSYLQARGYDLTTRPATRWQPVDPADPQTLSIGPSQYMQPLAQRAAQCNLFGRGLTYILEQFAQSLLPPPPPPPAPPSTNASTTATRLVGSSTASAVPPSTTSTTRVTAVTTATTPASPTAA